MLLLLLPAWGQQGLGCWELLLRQVLLQLNRSTGALLALRGSWSSTWMQAATLEMLLTQVQPMGWGLTLLLLVALTPEGPPLSPCLCVRKFKISSKMCNLSRRESLSATANTSGLSGSGDVNQVSAETSHACPLLIKIIILLASRMN